MMEALPPGSGATALLEIDTPADEQDFRPPEAETAATVDVRWLHRAGRSEPGDPSPILAALGDVALPAGPVHAYVAAEAGVVRRVREALTARGLEEAQISAKAYWRRGLPNAEHGEPARDG
jgi:NADPH-dependent ferric siderophore reductase